MATERLSMRKTREILRQKWDLCRSHRDIAASLGIGVGTVSKAAGRAKAAGLDWSTVAELSEEALERRLYGEQSAPCHQRPLPSPTYIHEELHKTGVTLQLLHLEYLEQHPGGYKYTQFCEAYRRWQKKRGLTMRHMHHAGEKLFVDYSGKKPEIVNPETGECVPVELFVAVLGASNYTYAEATLSQRSTDWIGSHIRAFEYLQGIAKVVVPDQLRSGVSKPCWYEPGIQRTYDEMARHYGTVVIPARPGKSRDKAKVENAVLIAQRWILARLRNQAFFSLAELNDRIKELLEDLNGRVMRDYGKSRQELYETLDRPALMPLPSTRFVYGEWKVGVGVNIDYHIQYDFHYYSVPYQLARERVDVRAGAMTIEIFFKGRRVASHSRSRQKGRFTTNREHMPKSHRAHAEWTPERIINWAGTVGPNAQRLVRAILEDRPHPEQGYRSCLGILRLAEKYGSERLEQAAARAFFARARSYTHVESILKTGLDRAPLPNPDEQPKQLPLTHANLRGAVYYKKNGDNQC